MGSPKTHSLALHEFAGMYRGVHHIEGGTEAGVGEIAISIRSSGVKIARATLEGIQKDAYSATEVQEVNPDKVRLIEDLSDFKAFQLGQQIMAISHRTDDVPSLVLVGDPEVVTTLFGPDQVEVFNRRMGEITRLMGAVPRLPKNDC